MSVDSKMTAIADNIRDKTGGTEPLSLDEMAESIDEVYEAGQKSMVDESKIIEATATGTGIVNIDDISEIPHDITVQLSSDTITDFSGVELKQLSGNLFDINSGQLAGGANTIVDDDSITVSQPAKMATYTSTIRKIPNQELIRNVPLTISADIEMEELGQMAAIRLVFLSNGIAFTKYYDIHAVRTDSGKLIAKGYIGEMPDGYTLGFALYANWTGTNLADAPIKYSNIELKIGGDDSLYESYNTPKTYYPDTNGNVIIKRGSSNMILTTDEAVNITVNYHKSYGRYNEWALFWDVYQKMGRRNDYEYGFYGTTWTEANFRPKYDIRPEYINKMFKGCVILDLKKCLEDCGVVMDLSNASSGTHIFLWATVRKLPEINLSAMANLNQTFYGVSALQSIDKLVLADDGSQTFNTYPFYNNSSLTDIIIEGLIGCSVSFQWSPLTVESAISVITHLKDYSGTDSEFANTLTLSSSTKTALEAEGATSPNGDTWVEYIKDIGWNLE